MYMNEIWSDVWFSWLIGLENWHYFLGIKMIYFNKKLKQVVPLKILSLISESSGHKNDKSCYQLIWPFYGLLQPYEQKFQKSPISVSSVHKYHKSCTQLNWPFYGLLQLYEKKVQKSHNSVC